MATKEGLTLFKKEYEGRHEIYVSGFFSSVSAALDADMKCIDISAMCWGNDSRYGMGTARYTINDDGVFKDGWKLLNPTNVSEADLHYIGVCLQRMAAISPEGEPYRLLRNRVAEALKPIYQQQPCRTTSRLSA